MPSKITFSIATAFLSVLSLAPCLAEPSKSEISQTNKLLESNSDALIPLLEKKYKEGKNLAFWNHIQALYILRNARRDTVFSYTPARNAATLESNNDNYLVTWALTLTEMNKFPQAQQIIDKVLKRSNKNARAHAVQSYILASEGSNNAFAEDEIRTAIKFDGTDPDVNNIASIVYKKLVKEKECREALARWTKAHPQDARAHLLLSQFYFDTRERQKSIDECKAALKINPAYNTAQRHLIHLYHNMDKLKELIAYAAPVLTPDKLDIVMEQTWSDRADAYRAFKQWDKAASDYGQGLKCIAPKSSENTFDPEVKHLRPHLRRRYFEIWLARCQMLSEAGKSQLALDCVSKMISALPDNPGARQTRIEISDKANKLDIAIKDIDFLISKDPDVAEWYKMKAKILRKLKREADAQKVEKQMKMVIESGGN